MEDRAPCHTAKKTKEWQNRNGIKRLPWPSQSPDMNPVEHLWTILDQAEWKKSRKPTSWTELQNLLREARVEIPQEKISEFFSSMPEKVKNLHMASLPNTCVCIKMDQIYFKCSINKFIKNHGIYLLLSCL